MFENDNDYDNFMKLRFAAQSQNEAFARVAVASFITYLNPTVADITDVKTSVSEAVTNAIIHGYDSSGGEIELNCAVKGREIFIEIKDKGKGIEDIEQAMEPLFTSKPEMERSGMGFTVMETFMDYLEVISTPGTGAIIIMRKVLE